uniref:uncharacterized protein LOC117161683 n=1 Tax=Bombus vancouverensis nearcticus TaxID=2705178 RepID=UPI0014395DBF|nr:uncharacterized protein LOC117161683 [Bombus vancouverensis nearcticus]XP_033204812.1 uncharacterized protein LOC117165556 [Bombus vancouverensis nearcticus]
MEELIRTLTQRPSTETMSVALPRFNPGNAGTSPASWCAAGTAAEWLTHVPVNGLTWTKFRELFLARYGGTETATSVLIRVLDESPLEDETAGTFGNRLHSLLSAKWGNLSNVELINAVILLRLIWYDQRFERIAFGDDIRTLEQFQREMKIFSHAKKRPVPSPNNPSAEPEAKRRHSSARLPRCLHCGKPGHKLADCRTRKREQQQRSSQRQGGRRPDASPQVVCFKCQAEGHIAPDCPLRRDKKASTKNERVVNCCAVESPAGTLSHLGNTRVKSTSQILSTVCINGLTLEITFHVLADTYLNYDIMVGREILSQGFDVYITRNSVDICRTKVVNTCSKTPEDEIDINAADTDVIGNDKSRLISVLEKFKDSFITGFPRARVSTGQLEIRLIDPNVTVQRSPYRLSEEERRIVRERIDELIKAKIVRPSNPPFASPILLVKKKDGSDRLCVDFRALNKNTVADRYPLPLIADQIARLQKARYFISLDMASGFHQIPIHPNSTEYTAFVTPDGQYDSEGYGAILMHRVEDKNRVVEYYSKRTSPAESRYHSYELETLAVVNAVKHFRHYLHGREFLVVTDCNSLKASSSKDRHDRLRKMPEGCVPAELDVCGDDDDGDNIDASTPTSEDH